MSNKKRLLKNVCILLGIDVQAKIHVSYIGIVNCYSCKQTKPI